MDVQHYKSLIDVQRKRTFNEIQKSFIDFVFIDILECGKVEYLIAEDDWYLYWQDVSAQIKDIIDDLIQDEVNIPERDFDEMLKECIEIKMIADKNITSYKDYKPEEVYSFLGIETERSKKIDFIQIACEESEKSKLVKLIHDALSTQGFLKCTIDDFYLHFNDKEEQTDLIQWFGYERDIIALFINLIDGGILPKYYNDTYFKKIAKHFINREGNYFKPNQLSSVRSQYNLTNPQDFKELVQQLVSIKTN